MASGMFYTMMLHGRLWNRTETTREGTGTLGNLVEWSGTSSRTRWKTRETTGSYFVSYRPWARLAPTLTYIVTYVLVTSGAEDGRCHHSLSKNDGLPRPKRMPVARASARVARWVSRAWRARRQCWAHAPSRRLRL